MNEVSPTRNTSSTGPNSKSTSSRSVLYVGCLCVCVCVCVCVWSSSVSRCSRKSVTRVDPEQPHVGFPTACPWLQPRGRSLLPLLPGFPLHCLPNSPGTLQSYVAATAHCASHLLSSRRLPASESALSTSSLHREAIGTIKTAALP